MIKLEISRPLPFLIFLSQALAFLSSRSLFDKDSTRQIGFLISDDNYQRDNLLKIVAFAEEELNSTLSTGVRIVVRSYKEDSLYGLVETTCSLVQDGVSAVVSPQGSNNIADQADILGPLNIPLVSVVATDPLIKKFSRQNMLLLSPGDEYQARAIVDLLKFYRWQEISLVASDTNYGTNAMNALQNLLTLEKAMKFSIKSSAFFRSSHHLEHLNFNSTLEILKLSLTRVIVLVCEGKFAKPFFQSANRLGLMSPGFVWIVSDAITANYPTLAFEGQYPSYYEGLIGLSPAVDTTSSEYRFFKDKFLAKERTFAAQNLTPHLTLSYDAFHLVSHALEDMGNEITRQSASCSLQKPWPKGIDLSKRLRKMNTGGITGLLQFNEDGSRVKPAYNVVNFVNPGSFATIGKWTTEEGLNMYLSKHSVGVQFPGGVTYHPSGSAEALSGQHLRLGITENKPFASEIKNCVGTHCWEGITPDTVRELAKVLKFSYEFIEPTDRQFGTYDHETETWNGLIGDLLSNKIDMIAMDLSVSFERKTFIDFSVSFMDSGISLAVRGQSDKGNVFFFLSPFSESVWIMVIVSIVIVSLVQSLFNKLSPSGEYGRIMHAMQVCSCEDCSKRREVTVQENVRLKDYEDTDCLVERAREFSKEDMSLFNAVWVVGAGFVGQAGEAMPTSSSGRFVLFTWWFFVMLMTSLYTANLTAFITLDKIGVKIDNAKDLLNQNRYKWGLLNQSFVEDLLDNNIDPEYKKILQRAEKLTSLAEGVQRVRDGDFVFIDETPAISYHVMGECDIFYVGGEVQTFDYAFGFPKNSPYTPLINAQLIRLRERGFFDDVWKKWDKTPDHEGCGSNKNKSKGVTLTLTNTRGIFLFLCIGIFISLLLILLEMVIAACKDEGDANHQTFKAKLVRRIRLKILDIQTQWMRTPKKEHTALNGTNNITLSGSNGVQFPEKPFSGSQTLRFEPNMNMI